MFLHHREYSVEMTPKIFVDSIDRLIPVEVPSRITASHRCCPNGMIPMNPNIRQSKESLLLPSNLGRMGVSEKYPHVFYEQIPVEIIGKAEDKCRNANW